MQWTGRSKTDGSKRLRKQLPSPPWTRRVSLFPGFAREQYSLRLNDQPWLCMLLVSPTSVSFSVMCNDDYYVRLVGLSCRMLGEYITYEFDAMCVEDVSGVVRLECNMWRQWIVDKPRWQWGSYGFSFRYNASVSLFLRISLAMVS
jgi:hypothetical protein